MGKKKKAKKQAPAPNFEKIRRGLGNLQAQLAKSNNQENLEKIKFTLIKLYDQLKTNPNTDDLNEKRIELLKECNLNLQILDRDENVWTLIKQHHVQQAYDQSIFTLKMMNEHPQRYWIKSWVGNIAIQTMQKIAELATSLPINQKNHMQQKEVGHTFINPGEGSAISLPKTAFSTPARTSQDTLRPKDLQQQFDKKSTPFSPMNANLLEQTSSQGDTFKPFPSTIDKSVPFPTQLGSDPPWDQESSQDSNDTMRPPSQNVSVNSIQTFWDKDAEKTQKVKPNGDSDLNSPENMTDSKKIGVNNPTGSKTKKIDSKEPI